MEKESRERVSRDELDVYSMLEANTYLAIGDSASALRMAWLSVDTSMVFMSISSYFVHGITPANGAACWPRMMLMRADLAAAAGHHAI